jgi:hypothetical protein
VTTAITASLRRKRVIRRNPATSMSRSAAKITTAPSAARGNRASSPHTVDRHNGQPEPHACVRRGKTRSRADPGAPTAAVPDHRRGRHERDGGPTPGQGVEPS